MPTLDDVRAVLADQTQGFPQVAAAVLDYLRSLEDRVAWLERDRRPWRAAPETPEALKHPDDPGAGGDERALAPFPPSPEAP